MNTKKLFLAILLFLSSLSLFGQGKVSGTVIEQSTKQPIEYATVEVLIKANGKSIAGTTSNSAGKFSLDNLPFGNYELRCSFIGFEMVAPCFFTLDKNSQVLNLGIFELAESSQNLNEVVVSGQKSTYFNKIDKKVFNVGSDLMSTAASVSDLMQNIPSVQVDIDGGVSLRGSENVQILLNGKQSSMMGTASRANILQQIPASSVERIEIITNPSAKYKPDGTSGIINIVMKKERNTGFNGTLAANAGNANRYNATLSLNYNPGKVNFFIGYGLRFDDRSRYSFDERTKTSPATGGIQLINQNTESTARPVSHLFRAGIDWEIAKNQNLQIAGSYNFMDFLRTETTPNIYRTNGDTTLFYTRFRRDNEWQKGAELSAIYEYSFGEEHALTVDYTFSSEDEQEDNKYINQYFFPAKYEKKDNTLIRQGGTENLIRANYARPIGENSKMEVGTEIELDRADMNYFAENQINNSWVTDNAKSNHFVFDEDIFALYGTYEADFGKFGIMGGLRAERAFIKSRMISTDTVIPDNYSNFFPTLHTAYKLNDANELQLNYSLRINRPEGDDLNPFPEYKDPLNVSAGNPHLKPEKIHSVEFGYQLKTQSTTFLTTLYYRNIFNKMTEVSRFINDSVMLTTKENMSASQSSGFEFIVNSSFGKWANINFNTNIFYNIIDASDLGYGSNKSAVSWYASLNGNFNITKNLMAQLNTRYKGKSLTPQGFQQPSFILNLGAKYDLFNKRATVLFTVSDLLNTYKSVTTIDTPELKARSERKRPSQIFYIGFTYNFGISNRKKDEAAGLKYDEQL